MTTLPADTVHATISELGRAYLAADYRWQHDGDWHELNHGLQEPALELLYPDRGTFGMLSARNPRSDECAEAVNRDAARSEERRGGKEGVRQERCRWEADEI